MEPLSPSSASPIGAILSSVSEGRDDFSASAASLGQVAIDSAATGRWKKGDRDWFAVSLHPGRSYQFQLSRRGKSLTPQLHLIHAYGHGVAPPRGHDGSRWGRRRSCITARRRASSPASSAHRR